MSDPRTLRQGLRAAAVFSFLAIAAPAQSFVVPPGTSPLNGTCNAYPFNTANVRYQALVRAAELGNAPGTISGIAVSPCSTGVRTMAKLEVRLAHYTGGTLSTTFDTNLNSPGPAVTVLDTQDHAWVMVANDWNEVGLQTRFAYNGVDDLVVEITALGSAGVSGSTHREGTNERVYLTNYAGQTTGSKDSAAFKVKLFFGDANTQTFGVGCAGSAGTPVFRFAGTAQLGTPLGFECSNAMPTGLVLFGFGAQNRGPVFPVDLTPVGAPGCHIWHDLAAIAGTNADANGLATVSLTVPTTSSLAGAVLYSSALLMDPAANAVGWVSSNYGRALLGN